MNFCPTCGTPVAWASGAAAEVRESACLAVEVSGQAKLAGILLPAQINGYINACLRVIEDACVAYGGMVLRRYAAGVTAVFGAPVAGEREVERAVRAALTVGSDMEAISRRVENATGTRLTIRCAVDFGPMRVSAFAGGAAFVTTGSPVNNALELRAAARPSSILISAAAAAHVKGIFQLHPVPLAHVAAGSSKEAYEIAGSADGTDLGKGRTPFVGRRRELALLRTALAKLAEGQGGVVALAGPAGIGKSRLRSEVFSKPGGPRVFVGRCMPATAEGSYYVFRAALEGILAEYPGDSIIEKGLTALGTDAPFLTDALSFLEIIVEPRVSATVFPSEIPGEVLRERSYELVEKIVTNGSKVKPVALVFEDLQWLGSSGADILYRLAAKAPHIPLLLILTARDPAVLELFTANVATLAPLADEEAHALLTAILPPGVANEEFLGKAVRWAAGNPLYCEELAASVGEAGTGELEPPASVKAAVRARLDKLNPGALIVAKTAACFGLRAEIGLLKEVVPPGVGDIDVFLREVSDGGFADIDDGFMTFRNEITRDILMESWVETDRARVWGAIATAAAGRKDDAATVAHYLAAAGRSMEAVRYLKEAGDQARGLFLAAEAVVYYERALQAEKGAGFSDKDLHFGIITELAESLCETAAPGRALGLLTDAFSAARNNAERAKLFGLAGYAYNQLQDYRKGLLFLEDARRLYHALGERQDEGNTLRDIAAAYGRLGDNAARRKMIAMALACYTEVGDDVGVAFCYNGIGADYVNEGDPARALEFFKDALETWTRVGHVTGQAMALANIGIAEKTLGRFHLAADHLERAVKLNRRCGTRGLLASNLCNYAVAIAPLDPPRGEGLYKESLALAEAIGFDDMVFAASVNLAEQYRFLGRWDEARASVARALEIAARSASPYNKFTAALSAAAILVDKGDLGTAELPGYFETVDAFAAGMGTTAGLWKAALQVAFARARGDAGEISRALPALEKAIATVKTVCEVYDGYYRLGMGKLALGVVDEAEEAFRWIIEQTGDWHKMEWPRALYGLALVALRRGSPGRAQPYLTQARDIFASYGAGYWLDRIKAVEAGLPPGITKGNL